MKALICTCIAASFLSGCATVAVPDVGQNLSEFRDSLGDLDKAYMQAEELPERPTGVRSDREWDDAARDMLVLRDNFETPPLEPSLSDDAFDRAFREAQDYADAYKDDDPK